MDEVMGISTQYSFVPHPVSKYTKKMTFIQRSYNTLLYLHEAAVRRFSYMPAQNKLAKKYFRESFEGEIPDLSVVQKRISVMLSNTHRLTNTRPKMAAQVDIAGAHLKESVDELPRHIYVSRKCVARKESKRIEIISGHYQKFETLRCVLLSRILHQFWRDAQGENHCYARSFS
jgi:hypothetical protein